MDNDYLEECETIDASVFSGEMLCPNNIESFKMYVARWQRAIEKNEQYIKQESENSGSV